MLLSGVTRATLASVRYEPDRPERRQRHLDRVLLLVPRHRLRLEPQPVADVRAAVEAGVRVQRLAPRAAGGQAEPPAVAHDRGEVCGAHERPLAVRAEPDECEHVLARRVLLEPADTLVGVVELPERR